jgi:hypothetical protein
MSSIKTAQWAKVELSPSEMFQGANVGLMRQLKAIQKGLKHVNEGDAKHIGKSGSWAWHVEGAMAEMAVAKYLGLFWSGTVGVLGPGDVAGVIEVRQTDRHGGRLIIRPKDAGRVPYVLVTGFFGEYRLQGWLYGDEGRREQYLNAPNGRPPAYMVPQNELRPMSELVLLTQQESNGK